jgi:hypothetical protein
MNEKASIRPVNAANDYAKASFHDKVKAVLPAFLRASTYK